ncbi:MAG TPA: condensation domain-containing protein [Herpetosiphonaceae bacterium]
MTSWQQVFDDTYRRASPATQPTLNLSGWTSSYTGAPIPEAEMRAWVDQTVARIAALRPRRVLEIGCGTGLLLFRIAPSCERYVGTDLSQAALEHIQAQLSALDLSQVALVHRAADQLGELQPGTFDTVILNSVVQYFPSVGYLLRVLEAATRLVAPGGHVFVGDLRSLPLLELFHTSVEFFRAPDTLPTLRLHQRIRRGLAQEQELAIDPAFFHALARHLPGISHLDLQLKRGTSHNELTKFRYDAVLRVGSAEPICEDVPRLDWREQALTIADLRRHIAATEPERLLITGVPNARLSGDLQIAAALARPDRPATTGELRSAVASVREAPAVDPEDAWSVGEQLGYTTTLGWSGSGPLGSFDLLLSRQAGPEAGAVAAPAADSIQRPWSTYANNPLHSKLERRIVPALRSYLKERLPEHMVPSAIVLLDALPLTPNGKLDRSALPAPIPMVIDLDSDDLAPRTPTEQMLAAIWCDVLGLEQVSITSNFFALGGDSIHSIQVVFKANRAGLLLTPRHLFQHQTIAELAAAVDALPASGAERDAAPGMVSPGQPSVADGSAPDDATLIRRTQHDIDRMSGQGGDIEDVYPLGPLQDHLLSQYLAAPQPGLYLVQRVDAMPGPLDRAAFERAWQQLAARHAILRTSFSWEQEPQPLQVVHTHTSLPLAYQDWRGVPAVEQQERLMAYLDADRQRGIELRQPTPIRVCLAQVADDAWQVIFSFNYMCLDGWSLGLLLNEFSTLYAAYATHREVELAPTQAYADYIAWVQQQDLQKAERFWKTALSGMCPAPSLIQSVPGNRPGQAEGFTRQHRTLHADTTDMLQTIARAHRITLNTLVQAAWALLVSDYTGAEDVVFGVVVSGRPTELAGADAIVGPTLNILPLRVQVPRASALLTLLQHLREHHVTMSQYEYTPMRKLREWLELPHDGLLFDSYLIFQNLGVVQNPTRLFFAQMEYPLRIDVFPGPAIVVSMSYHRPCFDDATISRMLQRFQALLDAIARGPEQRIEVLLRF